MNPAPQAPPQARALQLQDEAQTRLVARVLASLLKPKMQIHFSGPLGVGKTTLIRALLLELKGEAETVPSPSYTIAQEYERGGLHLLHIDLWRTSGAAHELHELGIEEARTQGAVLLIEWPERIGDALPPPELQLHLQWSETRDDREDTRALFASGPRAPDLLDRLHAEGLKPCP